MIIKRRVTRQFVQIANEVVRDQSITLDAHGMLHYLLSLPDNWEINLRQIEKFWSIGPTKRQRIFGELAKAGWLKFDRMRGEEGEYLGARWIVCDEPEPPQPGEVESIEEDGEPLAATKPDAPESQAPASASHGDRQAGLPSTGPPIGRVSHQPENRAAESRRNSSDEYRDSTNTTPDAARDDDRAVDGLPPPPFGALSRLWPRDNIASAFACEKVFDRLTDKQRNDALRGAKPYLDDCRAKGQNRLCDLRTYLDERRWERFTERGIRGGAHSSFVLKAGMPETERWRNHYREFEPAKLKFFEHQIRTGGVYQVPSQWPPPRSPESLTRQDSEALANL